jgi:peptide/nickel transport system substrate-binding protein
MLAFNETPGHLTADPEVRKAIVQAIDRSQFNNVQSRGAGTVTNSLGQDTYPCYDPSLESAITKPDAAAAAKVLKDKNITIIGTNVLAGGDNNGYILSALQGAGAKATLQNLDNQAYIGDLFSGKNDWDVTVFAFGNPLNSLVAISGYFSGGTPPNGRNFASVDNPDVAGQLAAAGANDGIAGCKAITSLQKSLFERNDVLPLATAPVNVVFAGGSAGTVVKGFVLPSSIRISG